MNKTVKIHLFLFTAVLLAAFLLVSTAVYAESKDEEPLELEIETKVTAPPIEKFMVTTSVITKEEIDKTPARNVEELLQNQNGVFSLGSSNKKSRADLSIRGFGINYIRVFIDGVPLNTANERLVDLNLIPVEIIERIEVIKGPSPVTYGSDSMGGIINIVTKSGRKSKGVFAKAEGGSFGTFKGSAAAGAGGDKWGLFVTGGTRSHNGYRTHTAQDFTDIFVKGDYDFTKKDKASLFLFHTGGNRECSNAENPDGTIRPGTFGFWSGSYNWEYKDIKSQGINLLIRRKADKGIGYKVNAYYRRYDDTLRGWVDAGTATKPGSGSPFAYYRAGDWNYSYWESYIWGGDARIIIPAAKHKITAGASIERPFFSDTYTGRSNPGDPAGSLSRPKSQWNQDYMNPYRGLRYTGVYLQDEVELNKNLIFTLGLRNDSYSKTSSMLNGIANLVYTHKNDTFRATAGKTGRFPTLKELEGRAGNPNLKAEEAWNYELGWRKRIPKYADVEAAFYYSSVRNLIQPTDPNVSFSPNINVDRARIYGTELNLVRKWKNLEGRAGYTWNRRVSPDLALNWEDLPQHKALASLKWEKQNNVCWMLEGVLTGSRKTGDAGVPVLPSYGIVNAKLAYPHFGNLKAKGDKEEGSNWNAELTVTNIFDKKYQNVPYYYMPGRWITGAVKFRF